MQDNTEESLLVTMFTLAVILWGVQRSYTQPQAILQMLGRLLRDFFTEVTVLLKDLVTYLEVLLTSYLCDRDRAVFSWQEHNMNNLSVPSLVNRRSSITLWYNVYSIQTKIKILQGHLACICFGTLLAVWFSCTVWFKTPLQTNESGFQNLFNGQTSQGLVALLNLRL